MRLGLRMTAHLIHAGYVLGRTVLYAQMTLSRQVNEKKEQYIQNQGIKEKKNHGRSYISGTW